MRALDVLLPAARAAGDRPKGPLTAVRSGFTLIELIVLLLVMAVAATLLLPAIVRAREAARNAQCKDNLRQIGVATHAYAVSDPQGRLCSGAIDAVRDGCPDTYGWAADVWQVKQGVRPGALLCPSSLIRGTETLNDLLTSNDATGTQAPADRLGKGFCGRLPRVGAPPTPAEITARSHVIAPAIRQAGMNTNYAQSWLACRGSAQTITVVRGLPARMFAHPNPVAPTGFDDLRNTKGALTVRQVETANIPSNAIPLLGDAARSTAAEARLMIRIVDKNGVPADGELQQGTPLGKSYNRGPAFGPGGSAGLPEITPVTAMLPVAALIPQQYPTVGTVITPSTEPNYASLTAIDGVPGGERRLILCDTRAWSVQHGRTANILTADGAVKEAVDLNGDGFFNPGFAVPSAIPRAAGTYTDGAVELNAFDIFCGAVLNPEIYMKCPGGDLCD